MKSAENLVYSRHGMDVHKTRNENGTLWEISGCGFCDIKILESKSNRGNNGDQFEVTLTTEGQQMLLENGESNTLNFSLVGPMEFEEFVRGIVLFAKVRHDRSFQTHAR